jgi:anti-sigma B factor antagonist
MEIGVRKYQEKHIVDVRGELDLYNAFRLKETVQKMVAMDIRVFILNLKGVDYVDSSGIGALLAINHLLARDGRKLRIANITRPVQKVMELTRLTGFLPLCKSVREAVDTIDEVPSTAGGGFER